MNRACVSALMAVAGLQFTNPAMAYSRQDLNACNLVYTHENPDDGITACKRLIGELPSNLQDGLYLNLGIALTDAKRYDEALAAFNKALELSPQFTAALSERGNMHVNMGRFDEATADYSRSLEINPNDPVALQDRCRSRADANKDLNAALADCELALKLDPTDPPGWRAFVYLRKGAYAQAIADYNVSITQFPKSSYFWFGREIAKLRTGDTLGGNNDIAAAEEIRPDIAAVFASYGITP